MTGESIAYPGQLPELSPERNLAACLDIMRCFARHPQTGRGIALIAQHAMRGIDPENTDKSGIDIETLDLVQPDPAELMPTLDRIHRSFSITTDGTKEGTPIDVTYGDLGYIVHAGAWRALDLLRDSAGYHSLNHRGPFVSMHTPAPELQQLLIDHPPIREDVSAEMDRRAAEVLDESRARQARVTDDHRQLIQDYGTYIPKKQRENLL